MENLKHRIKAKLKESVVLRNTVRSVRASLGKKYHKYNGMIIPPVSMRLMGNKLHDDEYYCNTALNEGERFIRKLEVTGETEILEVGCSSGRSVIGLIQKGGKAKRYVGFDSLRSNIDWCRKYIGRKNKWCEFRYIDLRHQLFNKTGTVTVDQSFRMDVPNESFDLIYVSSVLPNWDDHDLQIFVKDYYRILRPGGKVFVTNFIEEGVPKITENPDGYGLVYKYPRSVFRFEKDFFISVFTKAGFLLDAFEYGNEIDGQSSVFFSKPLS